jgi:hypothetical protein
MKKVLPANWGLFCSIENFKFQKCKILLLVVFLFSTIVSFSQDAFMGYNYVTTSYPLAWSASPTTFNATTNKEVVFSNSGGSVKSATICGTSSVSHYEVGGTAHYIEIDLTSNSSASSIETLTLTGSSNSTTLNTAKAAIIFSSSTTFSLTANILDVVSSDFFPASNGSWAPVTITPPAGTKSLRIYRRIYYNSGTGVAQTGSSSGFVQFGLGQTLRVASTSVDISATTSTPTTQASNIVFSNISHNTLTTAWTNGDGAKRAVFMKEGVQGTITNPSDGTAYTASADWSSKGTQLGTSGYYCVYNGTAATVDLSSLSGSTTYWFQVFEYNGTGAGTKYLNYYCYQ